MKILFIFNIFFFKIFKFDSKALLSDIFPEKL